MTTPSNNTSFVLGVASYEPQRFCHCFTGYEPTQIHLPADKSKYASMNMIYSIFYLTLFGYPPQSLITFVHISKKSACFPVLPEAERKTSGFLSRPNPSEFSEFLATFPTCSTASSVPSENNRQCNRSDAAYGNKLMQQNELFCSDVSTVLPKLVNFGSHNFASLDCRTCLSKTSMVQSSPPPTSSGGPQSPLDLPRYLREEFRCLCPTCNSGSSLLRTLFKLDDGLHRLSTEEASC